MLQALPVHAIFGFFLVGLLIFFLSVLLFRDNGPDS